MFHERKMRDVCPCEGHLWGQGVRKEEEVLPENLRVKPDIIEFFKGGPCSFHRMVKVKSDDKRTRGCEVTSRGVQGACGGISSARKTGG